MIVAVCKVITSFLVVLIQPRVGTRLVDDSLNLDYHDMGTFLISGINGVRITEHPRSDASHDRLEFRGTVCG